MNSAKPKIDIGKFIGETLKKTLAGSRSRVALSGTILFLHLFGVQTVTYLSGHHFSDSADGIRLKIANDLLIGGYIVIFKYLLIILLIIMSPAEHTPRRRFGKYVILLVSGYILLSFDIASVGMKDSVQKNAVVVKSFSENSLAIYGKVIFASYSRLEHDQRRWVAVAENLSPQTDGYIVIVQMNTAVYRYDGLNSLYHPFNDYSRNRDYLTNIRKRISNPSNCLQFTYHFPEPPKTIPELPAVDKYVKIIYDPRENGIQLYTDTNTGITSSFDSIPSVDLNKNMLRLY